MAPLTMAARPRLPRGHAPLTRCTPTAASRAGLQRALQALHGTAQPISGDDALALREQYRVDEQVRQPPLPLPEAGA